MTSAETRLRIERSLADMEVSPAWLPLVDAGVSGAAYQTDVRAWAVGTPEQAERLAKLFTVAADALEVCRMLAASYQPNTSAYALGELHQARMKAVEVVNAA